MLIMLSTSSVKMTPFLYNKGDDKDIGKVITGFVVFETASFIDNL